jgi:L-aspartate oxidase
MGFSCDFLVIGTGVAGLAFALEAAEHGSVLLVSKRDAEESNTRYAQGGVASVLSGDDSFESHVRDTLNAGGGLCHEMAVDVCVREGPGRIKWLLEQGVRFSERPGATGSEDGGDLDLGREGGHSVRRVAHASDMTGREIIRALMQAIRRRPNIEVLEHHTAIDLIMLSKYGGPETCVGAYVLDASGGQVLRLLARATVLSTGGAGKVYLYTSNPDVATGDGVAMAYRAGAEIANMEFYQFHPTCLFHPKAKSFLISEALRGEGAILRLPDGAPFMARHHERAELAPRDIVSRSIDFEMKRTGSEFVLLDITHRPADFIRERFPGIHAECLKWGIDITSQPIPVVPAAHFMCGGITTDLYGRSTIPGLWAIGEVACTGVHGANRLASNSLLEGLAMAHRAALKSCDKLAELRTMPVPDVPEWQVGDAVPSDEKVLVTQNWDELRRFMWNFVGIVRSASRLRRAARRIAVLQEEIHEYYWRFLLTRDLLELRNIATVAELIVASAASRHESRGLHFTLDHPQPDPRLARDTVLKRGVPPYLRAVTA